MPYCPNCKRDFEEGVTTCAFCEVTLVESLEPEKEAHDTHIENGVIVYSAFAPIQANQIEKALAESEIPCEITARPAENDELPPFLRGKADTAFDITVPEIFSDRAFDIIEASLGTAHAQDILGEEDIADGGQEEEAGVIPNNFMISAFADEASPEIDRQIEVLTSLGIEYIDLRGVDGKSAVDLTPHEAKLLKKKLDAAGIGVSCLASPCGKIGINDNFSAEMKRFRNGLRVADILETDFLRVFSFYMPDESADSYSSEVMRRMSQYVKEARGSNITLLNENEKGIFCNNVARCLEIQKNFEYENFGMIFDPANFIQCGVNPFPDAWSELAPYVRYMHIKDAIMGKQDVVPAGMGDGHIRELLGEFANQGLVFVSMEPHLSISPWMENIMKQENLKRTDGSDSVDLFRLAHASLIKLIG